MRPLYEDPCFTFRFADGPDEFWVERFVQFPGQHLFFFGSHGIPRRAGGH
jgi:hypothetical protein